MNFRATKVELLGETFGHCGQFLRFCQILLPMLNSSNLHFVRLVRGLIFAYLQFNLRIQNLFILKSINFIKKDFFIKVFFITFSSVLSSVFFL